MPLAPGTRLGPYEILAAIGAGGMGEVYRATDTKLGRDVAIKVIPDSFALSADRMARFTREAQVLASLNHPNIAAIYGVEENAIVMELVEGETLRGSLPLDQALLIIHQLIDAIEYAHDKGVVHRDLKPANIKITAEGRVKVLDFGLAKALVSDLAPTQNPAASPTLTMRATMAGMIMGTAAYMAPEQARGQNVDRRADIWAFGVVVYELLTGRQLFEGATVSDTLAAVLMKEPELGEVPVRVRRLLRLCLAKDARQRLSHISGARILLGETPAEAAPWRGVLPWVVAGLLAVVVVIALWAPWRAPPRMDWPLLQFSVDLGPDAVIGRGLTAVLSPDGSRVVFPSHGTDGKQRLSIRLLNEPQATPLSGTENGLDPFFSPNGQWIGFLTGLASDQKIKKISVTGGAAVTLCDHCPSSGASWGGDSNIIAAAALGELFSLPEAGGIPRPLTKPGDKGEVTHRYPQILPGGETVLFTANTRRGGYDGASIDLLSLKTGQWKTVHHGGYFGRYLPSGHLIYIHQGTLFGVAFDPVRGELQGTPAPLLEDVAANPGTGGGQFDFSQTGTLVYLSGKSPASSRRIAWLDRAGKTYPLLAPGDYANFRLSPDGKLLALAVRDARGGDISIYDPERDAMTKITFGGQRNTNPVWTPDGKHIVCVSESSAGQTLSWIRADGAGEP